MRRLALLLLLAQLVPVLVYGGLFAGHIASFDGICGPHAPDIPAHACTAAEHRAEFAAGFGAIGIYLIVAASWLVATVAALGRGWPRRSGG